MTSSLRRVSAGSLSEVRSVVQGPLRVILIGKFLDSVGSGMTLSLMVVYLSQVRGFTILTASLALTWMAVVGLVITPLCGSLTDRFGPRPVVLVSVLVQALGVTLFAFVTSVPTAFAATALMSIGGAGIWGPMSTFVAQVVPSEKRSTAFAVNFMMLNLGLGLGGLIGASIVDVSRPETFTLLYLIDAGTYLLFWIAIASLRGRGGPVAHDKDDIEERGGWRVVLTDRRMLGLVLAALVMLVCGYGSLEAGIAIYITDTAKLAASVIGIVFLVNTLTIVFGQLFMLRLIRGRSRVRLMGLTALLWGSSWLLAALVPGLPVWGAITILLVGQVVFALGETVWSPTMPSLVNAISPDHLRGRYNAAQSLTWAMSSMVAPIFTGALIGAGRGVLWALIVGFGCIITGALAQNLRRTLTPEEDGRVATVA